MEQADGDATPSSPLHQLVDGFLALSREYKRLAGKYHTLQNHIAAATQELASLRQRYPSEPLLDSARERESKLQQELEQDFKSSRNLGECLEGIQGSQSALSQVRDAEFACYSLQNRLNGQSSRERSITARNKAAHPNAVNERDFTISRKPSTLQCPFVPPKVAKQPDASVDAAQNTHPPVPLTQDALENSTNGGSARPTTLNDPIEALQCRINSPSPAASDDGSDGPACPIRFLDKHSPEEVAKYFEEHKHELPRSHEACVKRFQANADSIRELDAKYGNLVSMIQGLGAKHQPMLPDTPEQTGSVVNDEDRKMNKRVKKWAKAISEGQTHNTKPIDDTKTTNPLEEGGRGKEDNYDDDNNEEQRMSHFDRPLKEIRVGESPSRPWGVPIPLQYLERSGSYESAPKSPVKAPSLPEPRAAPTAAAAAQNLPKQPTALPTTAKYQSTATHSRPADQKGPSKCPFDHTAFGAAGRKPKSQVGTRDFATDDDQTPKATDSATLPGQSNQPPSNESHIVNNGVAIIASSQQLGLKTLDNRGTLLLGYSVEDAQRILQRAAKQG